MSDFGNSRWVVGRKQHRCVGCRWHIPRGELHFHFSGKWEGDWQDWRLHAECHDTWAQDGYGEVRDDYPVPKRLEKMV